MKFCLPGRKSLLFESTGRREYTFGDMFTPNGHSCVLYGSDGGINYLSPEERKEIATYMIGQWIEWLASTEDTEDA